MSIRAVRGATQLDVDQADHLLERTAELMREVLRRNGLGADDVISIFLTATPDLRSAFPAAAVRGIGITDVPLMCAQELDIDGAMPRVVRLMAHVETSLPRDEVRHVYLHGTTVLRDDLAGDAR
ncbi:chorismate mutase [Phytoactinopolyspora alkaliphila]|uniref:chorismate mutase n=1 Tax=Phytoactinopolyspora alkaliphila TaxID=1783498 RepID=A0A6N9YU62_9ACTN|nr:chorismate mutase [Phytoactinopolyspora alkaliphila]